MPATKQTTTQAKPKPKSTAAQAQSTSVSGGKLVVVLVRGTAAMKQEIKDTFAMLCLLRKNTCAVFDDTPTIRGMLHKVNDYATWGEISAETFTALDKKRGRTTVSGEKKRFYPLSPPRKGFGRKGIKVAFAKGGALGYRGEKINDLIIRMI